MELRYGLNDLKRNKAVNIALATVLLLSAFLMATGAMVIERAVSSVDQLLSQARPPHFLQMHAGDYDVAALERFAAAQPDVEAWQVHEMVGFAGSEISWQRPGTDQGGDLSASLIDNLFVTQNRDFDLLLAEDGTAASPESGEVDVPVAYQRQFGLEEGDQLTVRTDDGARTLTVRGFVRDSQMASSMSSATRFVVSDQDFARLTAGGGGDPEVIVEYRLTDESLAAGFQRAYEAEEALPKNGQAVTYTMIRVINTFSHGLVAVALAMVSGVLILIALLNLRFVIRGAIEDDVRQIGAMKAMGIASKDIAGLYLGKYRVMALAACLAGGAFAVGATAVLTRGLAADFARAEITPLTVIAPVAALAAVYLVVMTTIRGILRRINRIDVVTALVHGSTLTARQAARRARRQRRAAHRTDLANFRRGSLNTRLTWLDLRAEGRQWSLIPLVFFLSTIVITVPTNMLSTFESPRFVTYMGAPEADLRADLQFGDDLDQSRTELLSAMREDPRLTDVRSYANVVYETPGEDARGDAGWDSLRVEVGDYSGGTVEFSKGGAPEEGQIALSALNAGALGVGPGDSIRGRQGTEDAAATEVEVSGIYQDVTSGGYTAKMQGNIESGANSYVVYGSTGADAGDAAAVAAEYNARYDGVEMKPMRDYVQQTLAYVTDAFRTAAIVALVFGVGLAALITVLFLQLRLSRDRQKMGILFALGFSLREVGTQVLLKTVLAVGLGTLAGVAVANAAGEAGVGAVLSLSGMGLTELTFLTNPAVVYVLYPLGMVAAGCAGAAVLLAGLRRQDKSTWLKEA